MAAVKISSTVPTASFISSIDDDARQEYIMRFKLLRNQYPREEVFYSDSDSLEVLKSEYARVLRKIQVDHQNKAKIITCIMLVEYTAVSRGLQHFAGLTEKFVNVIPSDRWERVFSFYLGEVTSNKFEGDWYALYNAFLVYGFSDAFFDVASRYIETNDALGKLGSGIATRVLSSPVPLSQPESFSPHLKSSP